MPSTRLLPTDPSYPPTLLALRAAAPPPDPTIAIPAPDGADAAPGGADAASGGDDAEPPALYLRGALPSAPGIAIVGTRAASDEAMRFARALARSLALKGFVIWSGGARGIDAAAHEGALDADAPTVVVAGSGHDRPYPPEHAPLFARVLAAGGALLARIPDDAPPLPWHFLQRNALLAALTAAIVVVEAGVASGARSTATAARRLGRPLLVVPHAPWDPRGAGCALELARGARAITRAEDVVAVVGAPPRAPWRRARSARADPRAPLLPSVQGAPGARAPTPDAFAPALARAPTPDAGGQIAPAPGLGSDGSPAAPLGADERAIMGALRRHPTHLDEICERTGLGLRAATRALLTLTLHAVVVEGPAGLYRRALR